MSLFSCCELLDVEESRLAAIQNESIEAKLQRGELDRKAQWSAGITVGRRSFLEEARERLGSRARDRRLEECDGKSMLREAEALYQPRFGPQMGPLRSNRRSYLHRI